MIMPHACRFHLIQEAVEWARQYGGWIAECADGAILWFDASVWTLTFILIDIKGHGNAEIGPWSRFDRPYAAGGNCA